MLSCKFLLSQTIKRRKYKKPKIKIKNVSKKQNTISNRQELQLQEEEEEDIENIEEGFNLKTSAPSHKHGVQPLGNLYMNPGSLNSRNAGLGNLQALTDEFVLDVLGFLDGTHLGVLASASKSFYVFTNHEPLWRNLVLDKLKGGFLFNRSWKSTYVTACYPSLDGGLNIGSSAFRVRDFYSDYLFQSWLCANLEMKPEWLERDNIVRKKGISVEEFVSNFEELNKPVLLEGCLDNWVALGKWDRDYLVEVCGDAQFSVGPVEMKLEDFFRYLGQAREERPLYLFDPKFADKVPVLGSEYEVPVYFKEDLFNVLGNERPDYRWIIIGPSGSGSSFHIDPNSTSAWNAVIKGSKKWVMFPPDVIPPGVHPSPDGAEVACPVSIIEWFMNFYSATRNWKKRPIECICKAGEVVFVPNGWWHLVINLEESIAITQNYVSRRNLLNVLDFLKRPNASTLVSGTRDRVNLHDKFKNAMESSFPGTIYHLVQKAEEKKVQEEKLSFWDSVTDSKVGAFNGFSGSKHPEKSFLFYKQLQNQCVFPDNLTFPFVVKACTQMGSLHMGIQAHCQILKHGILNDAYVQNSLVYMYATCGDIKAARYIFYRMYRLDVVSWTSMISGFNKCGDVESARALFDRMPEKNLVTWSIMISGYAKNNRFDKAVELFQVLQSQGVIANETVMVSVVSSCAHLGALEIGERAHDYMVKNKVTVNLIIGTALVDMYARCGSIEKAIRVFEESPERDVLSWTALIAGIAMHGYAKRALHYFSEMLKTGVTPRDITFTAVLSACSHGGLIERGLEIFESIKRDYGIEPRLEHYGCVVDLLGRAGKLAEAEKFLHEMPVKPNAPIWGALLGACRIHRNAEIAERAGKTLIQLQPEHSGYYVLLSNIYAQTNKWENVENMRQVMKERGVKKPPGYSLIEIDRVIHNFTIGDKTHPEIDKIERMWEEILMKIRLAGYTGNTADTLFDIDEEEKESALHRHSEKLALAFGIMKTEARTPIRIVKNLRVCEDCHTATKLISKVFERELIVRDRNRFHHFREGACSCMDYW
ncbi:PPR domain-containing protein/PPR_2 domain-containing protein/Cupin_8 domain-containing protein/DYW_deaminase domain-containing protein, partial [Cephalotus follicularis]